MEAATIALLVLVVLAVAGALWAWRHVRATEAQAQAERARLGEELERRERELAELRARLAREEQGREEAGTAAAEAERRLAAEREALQEARERLEAERHEHGRQLEEERAARSRLEQSRNLERTWVRELRSQVAELQARAGALQAPTDVQGLVLRVAIDLLGAEKGLLLSREDEDSDGNLDLVAAQGFENDPADSALAQRFACRVLERDETVRENDAPDLDRESRTPADDEIENLVAIPIYVRDRFSGVVIAANKPGGFDDHDDDVLLALGDHAGAVLHNNRLQERLRESYLAVVQMLAEAIEAKDPYLSGRSDLVSPYVAAVGDRLGFDAKRREELLFAWVLHDVGKIAISESILHKPGPLVDEERSLVALHPRIGYRLVEQVPEMGPLALHILHHHQHFDGTGYPGGLRGEQIPLEARIIGIADAFGELIADPRHARTPEEACAELERRAGTEFDPKLVRLFVEEVRRQPPGDGEPHALATALADPEIRVARDGPEPVLGASVLAISDSLTLLYGHRSFHEAAELEAERSALQGSPFAVVFLELTEIDAVNRSEGYARGDQAIRTAARAVERAAARHDGTAYRYGGARLALVLPGTDDATARRIASELAAELYDEPTVRCGVGAWRPGDSGHDVVDRARGELTGRAIGLEHVLGDDAETARG